MVLVNSNWNWHGLLCWSSQFSCYFCRWFISATHFAETAITFTAFLIQFEFFLSLACRPHSFKSYCQNPACKANILIVKVKFGWNRKANRTSYSSQISWNFIFLYLTLYWLKSQMSECIVSVLRSDWFLYSIQSHCNCGSQPQQHWTRCGYKIMYSVEDEKRLISAAIFMLFKWISCFSSKAIPVQYFFYVKLEPGGIQQYCCHFILNVNLC